MKLLFSTFHIMAPRRKRQRLSEEGAEAVTAVAESEPAPPAPDAVATAPTAGAKPKKKDDFQQRSLFVRSLGKDVTTEDLTAHFSDSYPIKHAVAVLDPATKECKGFGFVTFADAEDAQRALEELNGSTLKGKKIKVENAERRHRDVESDIPGQKKSTPAAATIKAKADREKAREEAAPPKLILRNLPWSIKTSDDLAALFRSYGKVQYATLPKNPNGQLKGFGFILLRGRKNAEKALEKLNGKEIDGRTIAVDWAVDKETWQTLQKEEQGEEAAVAAKDKEPKDEKTLSKEFGIESDEESDEEADSDEDDEDEDEDDEEDDEDDEDGGVDLKPAMQPNTLFIRNLPFTATDELLKEHFEQFGIVKYARVVMDHETERPRGTGFVCFVNEEDMVDCLRGVPSVKLQQRTAEKKNGTHITVTHSVLENSDADPTGKYTMDGRILQISHAVDKNEAVRLTAEGAASRFKRDKDKRRLYLLSEGTISAGTPLYEQLTPAEILLRETSAKQRQKLIQSNPSLHLSLTRLSVRNIPRSITSKDLKQLARQAVVGFAEDVKAGKRAKLSKEELARGGDEMTLAEKVRKKRGKGLVKQAKIVYETTEGTKVSETTGAGRSRGYGFIEYYTHRNALMGLRRLNGQAVDYRVKGELPKGKKQAKEATEDRKKRLIVEFAIENANVVNRRSDRETKSREQPKGKADATGAAPEGRGKHQKDRGKKRKREADGGGDAADSKKGAKGGAEGGAGSAAKAEPVKDDKLADRSRIIQKKRIARRQRKAGK